MVIIRLLVALFMLVAGGVMLANPTVTWRIYVAGRRMEGFDPDVFEQTDGWELYRVVLGVLFLSSGLAVVCFSA